MSTRAQVIEHPNQPEKTKEDLFQEKVEEVVKKASPQYDPAYHLPLVSTFFKEGASIQQLANEIGVHPRTLTRWRHKFPDFAAAIEQGVSDSQAFYEEIGRQACAAGKKVNPAIWIFTMKNRFGWSDKREVTDSRATTTSIREAIAQAEAERERRK